MSFNIGDLVMVLGVQGIEREDSNGYYLGLGNQANPTLKAKLKVDVGGCILHVEPAQVVNHQEYWDAKRRDDHGSDT